MATGNGEVVLGDANQKEVPHNSLVMYCQLHYSQASIAQLRNGEFKRIQKEKWKEFDVNVCSLLVKRFIRGSTYTKKVFDWFRSPYTNKTLALVGNEYGNEFGIENVIGYL